MINPINILSFIEQPEFLQQMKGLAVGHQFHEAIAKSAIQVEKLVVHVQPQLILLGMNAAHIDGLSLCEMLRSIVGVNQTQLVVISQEPDPYLHVGALQSGADDFVSIPVSKRLLKAKFQSWVRRFTPETIRMHGDVKVDLEAYQVEKSGELVKLGKKEFEILTTLITKPGTVYSREELMKLVWNGKAKNVSSRIIDVYVRKLRKNLGDEVIKTVKGVGYRV